MSQFRTSRAGRLSALVALGRPRPRHGRHGRRLRQHRDRAGRPRPSSRRPPRRPDADVAPSVGTTANGRTVSRQRSRPLHFIKKNGHVLVRGVVDGVVHKADGRTRRSR